MMISAEYYPAGLLDPLLLLFFYLFESPRFHYSRYCRSMSARSLLTHRGLVRSRRRRAAYNVLPPYVDGAAGRMATGLPFATLATLAAPLLASPS